VTEEHARWATKHLEAIIKEATERNLPAIEVIEALAGMIGNIVGSSYPAEKHARVLAAAEECIKSALAHTMKMLLAQSAEATKQ
jgi:hypothetical protein